MRTISYSCDRCGRPITTHGATKLNIMLQRGTDSTVKKTNDFCSVCFLKMKKAWTAALTMSDAADKPKKDNKSAARTETVADKALETASAVREEPAAEIRDYDTKPAAIPTAVKDQKAEFSVKEDPEPKVADMGELPNKTEESVKPEPKKRGRKPKPVNPEEWTGRTELFYGPIKNKEKEYILKLHVEEGLSPEKIAEKVHRIPKGIKRAISTAIKSGELDRLKAEFEKTRPVPVSVPQPEADDSIEEEDAGTGISNMYVKRSSYVVPAKTETIDGRRYDIGGIMALHKAGWPASEIAKEKNYDEDLVRVILERQTTGQL